MAVKKKPGVSRSIIAKARKVLQFARHHATRVGNQMELENALYAPGGVASETFPTEEERKSFMKTKEYDQLIELIISLPRPPLTGEVIEMRIPPPENGKKKARPRNRTAARRS